MPVLQYFFTKLESLFTKWQNLEKKSKTDIGLQNRPWKTNGILVLMRKRDSLYKEYTKESNPETRSYKYTYMFLIKNTKILLSP